MQVALGFLGGESRALKKKSEEKKMKKRLRFFFLLLFCCSFCQFVCLRFFLTSSFSFFLSLSLVYSVFRRRKREKAAAK